MLSTLKKLNDSQAIYKAIPKIVWAIKFKPQSKLGFGAFLANTPRPRPGCKKNQGAITVNKPNKDALKRVGELLNKV